MNRNFKSLSMLLVTVGAAFTISCNKDKETEGIGRITYYPIVEILGDRTIVADAGEGAFEDPGVKITLNEVEVDPTIDGEVDLSTPGIYTITYSAENEDGFSASDTRTVVVVDPAARLDDLTGSYARGAAVSNWAKVQDCVYTANNPGGVAANPPFDVKFSVYNIEPGIVQVPLQQSGALSPFYAVASLATGEPSIPFKVSALPGEVAYTWFMVGPNFGAAARIFVKQ